MMNSASQEKNPPHIPVMLSEVLEYLDLQENGVYIDGTVAVSYTHLTLPTNREV